MCGLGIGGKGFFFCGAPCLHSHSLHMKTCLFWVLGVASSLVHACLNTCTGDRCLRKKKKIKVKYHFINSCRGSLLTSAIPPPAIRGLIASAAKMTGRNVHSLIRTGGGKTTGSCAGTCLAVSSALCVDAERASVGTEQPAIITHGWLRGIDSCMYHLFFMCV